jgi:hypothetical protein
MEFAVIRLKIRTMNLDLHNVDVVSNANIASLKEAVFTETGVPVDVQRLIVRGALLKDSQSLDQAGLKDGDIVNLIANSRHEEAELEAISDVARWALDGLPSSMMSQRRRYIQRHELSASERMEAIRQNLITLEDLLSTRRLSATDPLSAFDYQLRQLHVGQWVDVRDTVDQWLEGQVYDLSPDFSLAFIHYNGWPEHWDEWITVSSDRIQPLRTYTVQHLTSSVASPLPTVPPDHGLPCPTDFDQSFMQSCAIIERVTRLMDRHYTLCTLLNHDQADPRPLPTRDRVALFRAEGRSLLSAVSSVATGGSEVLTIEPCLDDQNQFGASLLTVEQELDLLAAQLAPILDRTGRLMTDLASVVSYVGQESDDLSSFSLLSNESGQLPPQPQQIPVMPSQYELSNVSAYVESPELDVHVHLMVSQRGEDDRFNTI